MLYSSKRYIYAIGALLICIASLSMFLFLNANNTFFASQKPLSFVKEEYIRCITQKVLDKEKGECLNNLAIVAYDSYAIEDVIKELGSLTFEEKAHWCHETMHYLGWRAYIEEGSISKAFLHASELCDSGMYHGVMEEYLRGYGLDNDIGTLVQNTCAEALKNNPRFSGGIMDLCNHGLGHGLMFITASNLQKSLDYCDLLGNKAPDCYGGVFMEHIVSKEVGPLHNKADFNDSRYCEGIKEHQKNECYNQQGANFLSVTSNNGVNDVEAAMRLCLTIDIQYQKACFKGVAGNVPSPGKSHTDAGLSCASAAFVSEEAYQICVKGGLGFMLQIEHGKTAGVTEFCEAIDITERQYCYYWAGYLLKGWLTKDQNIFDVCSELSYEDARMWCKEGDNYSN